MLKLNDKVEVDGVVATIESIWAQGRHRAYKLSDGRVILDLDKAIAGGAARLIPDEPESFKRGSGKSEPFKRGSWLDKEDD